MVEPWRLGGRDEFCGAFTSLRISLAAGERFFVDRGVVLAAPVDAEGGVVVEAVVVGELPVASPADECDVAQTTAG